MNQEKSEKPIEDREPAPEPAAEGEPDSDDVEGHLLMPIDPMTARILHRAREDDVRRQLEQRRREREAKHPSRPEGRP